MTLPVMDTRLVIEECRRNPGVPGTTRGDACRTVLGGTKNCQDSISSIEQILWGTTSKAGVIDSNTNQRYTCITIEPSTKSYQGILSSTNGNGVVIPISTTGKERYALLSYGISTTAQNPAPESNANGGTVGFSTNFLNRAQERQSSRNFMSGATGNNFPTIGFELSQVPAKFNINHLSDNSGDTTNVGYLMLTPSALTARTTIPNAYDTATGKILVGLAGSTDKANQSPAPVRCSNTATFPTVSGVANTYNCSTLIRLPEPRGATTEGTRDKNNSFIRLSLPFVEADTQFEIAFYENAPTTAAASVRDNALTLTESQYIVEVQGHTGDRVRMVNANIGGMESSAIVPMWSAAVRGGGVSKCQGSGGCDSNNNPVNGNIVRYTTTYTENNLTLTCQFEFAIQDIFGNTGTTTGNPLNVPSLTDMDNKCKARRDAEMGNL